MTIEIFGNSLTIGVDEKELYTLLAGYKLNKNLIQLSGFTMPISVSILRVPVNDGS